jgi:hypothetical protein
VRGTAGLPRRQQCPSGGEARGREGLVDTLPLPLSARKVRTMDVCTFAELGQLGALGGAQRQQSRRRSDDDEDGGGDSDEEDPLGLVRSGSIDVLEGQLGGSPEELGLLLAGGDDDDDDDDDDDCQQGGDSGRGTSAAAADARPSRAGSVVPPATVAGMAAPAPPVSAAVAGLAPHLEPEPEVMAPWSDDDFRRESFSADHGGHPPSSALSSDVKGSSRSFHISMPSLWQPPTSEVQNPVEVIEITVQNSLTVKQLMAHALSRYNTDLAPSEDTKLDEDVQQYELHSPAAEGQGSGGKYVRGPSDKLGWRQEVSDIVGASGLAVACTHRVRCATSRPSAASLNCCRTCTGTWAALPM